MLTNTVKPTPQKTAHRGVGLSTEFRRATGVESLMDRRMKGPGSGRGFSARDDIKPRSMTVSGGGEPIEDGRELRRDTV
jgi:hypothetical protein